MKFELEEKDLKAIEDINRDIKVGKKLTGLVFEEPGGKYSISFTVKDPAKANYFIYNTLFQGRDREKIIDITGVDFTSLNFKDNNVLNNIEERLQTMLDFVREMKGEDTDGN